MGEKVLFIEEELIISDDAIIAECLKLPVITVVDSLGLKIIHKQVEFPKGLIWLPCIVWCNELMSMKD